MTNISATTRHLSGRLRKLFWPTTLGAIPFFVYVILRSQQFSEDGIGYLLHIEEKSIAELFIPNHLLFKGLLKMWIGLWETLGYSGNSLLPFQFLDALCGGIGIGLFFVVLTRVAALRDKLRLQVLLTLGLAGSFAYWYHSTNVEGTIIAVTLLIFAYLLMYKTPEANSVGQSLMFAFLAGFSTSLAILLGQNNIFFIPALMLGMWTLNDKKIRFKVCVVCATTVGIIVLIAYSSVAFGMGIVHSIPELLSWVSHHPAGMHFGGWLNPIGIPRSVYGVMLSFIAMDDIGTILKYALLGKKPLSELLWYLGTRKFEVLKLLLCFSLAVLVVVTWFKYRSWRDRHGLLGIAWIMPYTIFNVYWLGSDVQFWVVVLPAMWIVIGIICSRAIESGVRSKHVHASLGLAVVLLTGVNFTTRIWPDHLLRNNLVIQSAVTLEHHTDGQGLIITPDEYWTRYFKYFGIELDGIEQVVLLDLIRASNGDRRQIFLELDQRIACELAEGRPVYLRSIFDSEDITRENRSWLPIRNEGVRRDDLLKYFAEYKPRFGWAVGGETYWIIDPPMENVLERNATGFDRLTRRVQ